MLNILNPDLWRVIANKSPEVLSEAALRELWFNLLGYVTEVNEQASGTALVVITSEKTGRWRALDGFDLPFHITGRPTASEHWDKYAEHLKSRFPAWFFTDVIDSPPLKRGTVEWDAWVKVHETVSEALGDPAVRVALLAALDMSAATFEGDSFLTELLMFCQAALTDPVFRPHKP